MKTHFLAAVLLALAVVLALASAQPPGFPSSKRRGDDSDTNASMRKQAEEMLKSDHVKNVADATELAKMAADLRDDLDKTDAHVLSISLLKKTEEIEKLAHRIHGRLKR